MPGLGQVQLPLNPGPGVMSVSHQLASVIALLGTLGLCLVIASVYKATHRGLSYSQAFQFSLVLLGMLASAIMMVASAGILPAVGILGGFSLIRFRTVVKDPKDMAFILFVLVVGLAMGARLFVLGVITTAIVSVVIVVLTRMRFGLSYNHESIIRLTCLSGLDQPVDASSYETTLGRMADSYNLLSAVGHGTRMELTYGVRPQRGSSTLTILEALRQEPTVEHAELFDAKHQVEF